MDLYPGLCLSSSSARVGLVLYIEELLQPLFIISRHPRAVYVSIYPISVSLFFSCVASNFAKSPKCVSQVLFQL